MDLNNFKEDLKKEIEQPSSVFKTMSGNDWLDFAINNPKPKMLFGELWFEKEILKKDVKT